MTAPLPTLDLSVLDRADLINIALQRSSVLHDQPRPGQIIRDWTAGDTAPLNAAIDSLGTDIALRAATEIWQEYQSLRSHLPQTTATADIGCGYGFFDLFLARDTGCSLHLIDLETNENRHFGFSDKPAAYSNLDTARRLLVANGVASDQITTINPAHDPVEATGPVDLVVSLLSCGFHYPVNDYLPYLRTCLKPGGQAILDLRATTEARQTALLEEFGTVAHHSRTGPAQRVILTRANQETGQS